LTLSIKTVFVRSAEVLKALLSLSLGVILGVIREVLVVKYQGSIIDVKASLGAGTTWGLGHIDFVVYYALAQLQNPWMFYGTIYGSTVAAYFCIRRRNRGNGR
jgi:uncharacterized protein (DUF697 family)